MSQSAAASSPVDRPEDRYGSGQPQRRPRRRAVWTAVALSILAGIPFAIFGYNRMHAGGVRGDLFGYEVLDGQTVSVTINVTRTDPATPAVCIVRVRAADGSETGRREVFVAPSAEPTVQVTTTVKSTRQPLMGDIYGCGLDVPGYLHAD